MECPKCKSSSNLSRKYLAFYARVNEEGEDLAENFSDHESDTEMTDEFLCTNCDLEFEYDI